MKRLLMVTTISLTLKAFLTPFASYFRARGWKVDAMANGVTNCDPCIEAFDQVLEADWSRKPLDPRNLLAAPRKVRRVVAQGGYDLVHVHTPIAAFATRYALRNLRKQSGPKVIYSAHGFHFYQGGRLARNLCFLALEKLSGAWTDWLVTTNREDERAAHRFRLVPPDRVRYVPGVGVDTVAYSPDRVDEQQVIEVRQGLGLAPNDSLFLMLALFDRNKRHRDALRALAQLARPDVHLALTGTGPLMHEVQQLAGQLRIGAQVHFLGFRQDVPALIRASRALLLLSEREGLPHSVMQSLSLEVPVIGTDVRGTRDLLEGGCGLTVPVGDIPALAESMGWVIAHPDEAEAMGRRGRREMQGPYELQRILAQHEALYEEALQSA